MFDVDTYNIGDSSMTWPYSRQNVSKYSLKVDSINQISNYKWQKNWFYSRKEIRKQQILKKDRNILICKYIIKPNLQLLSSKSYNFFGNDAVHFI